MIEGLKIDVSGLELIDHLAERADTHEQKAARYAEQAKGVRELQGEGVPYQTNDPVQGLAGKRDEHSRKAQVFRFMADHLSAEETYRLNEQDLIRVEIVLDRW